VLLEHVGVQLDDAGQEVVAAQVHCARDRAAAGLRRADEPVLDHHGAAEDLLPRNHLGVGQDHARAHAASGSASVCTRVASRARTSASWTVPSTAARDRAPRRQLDHNAPALRVQRGGGLVQQEHRIGHHEHPRDVDPLLLAPRERDRGERPEALRDPQPVEERARPLPRLRRRDADRPQRLRDHLDRHPGHHPELADVAIAPPNLEN
jgi:hypothetical protein